MKPVGQKLILSIVAVICLVLTSGTASAAERINLQALMAKKVPVLLEFGRGWCIPCKYMKPTLNDMARTSGNRAVISTVDMDANANLVREFGIRMMPTQVFLTPYGKEFYRNEGTLERHQIADIFAGMGLGAPEQRQGAVG